MTRFTYSGAQTFTARAYDLQPDDELDIVAGAVMTGQYAAGPLITALRSAITNRGTISNIATVVQMGAGSVLTNYRDIFGNVASGVAAIEVQSSAAGETNVISNYGWIRQTDLNVGFTGGIAIHAAGNVSIYNSGTIQAASRNGAITVEDGVSATIVNYGDITVPSVGNAPPISPGIAISAAGAHVYNATHIGGSVSVGTGDVANYGDIGGVVTAHNVVNYGTIGISENLSYVVWLSGTAAGDSVVNEGTLYATTSLGDGDDVMINRAGQVLGSVNLGAGHDGFNGAGGRVAGNIIGGPGDDSITGGSGNDRIYGDDMSGDAGAGNDILFGGGGTDTIRGGAGNDLIAGNLGSDLLYGEAGDDLIYGGQDGDTIYGGAGNDILYGDVGNDQLYGEGGSNTYVFAPALGHDTINTFGTTANNFDIIRFKADTLYNYADVQAHMIQQGANVVILVGANDDITILDINVAALTADHFLFG